MGQISVSAVSAPHVSENPVSQSKIGSQLLPYMAKASCMHVIKSQTLLLGTSLVYRPLLSCRTIIRILIRLSMHDLSGSIESVYQMIHKTYPYFCKNILDPITILLEALCKLWIQFQDVYVSFYLVHSISPSSAIQARITALLLHRNSLQ